MQCKSCPKGRFSDAGESQISLSTCQFCADGTYTLVESSTSCDFCPAGFAFVSTTSPCRGCAPGQYQSQNDAAKVVCRVCDGGKYANFSNASACSNCPPGRNNLDLGVDASFHDDLDEDCQECSVGRYNFQPGLKIPCFECETAKTAGATTCDGCNPGMFKIEGGQCIGCQPGRFSDARDAENCLLCPAGYYGLEVTSTRQRIECDACPRGTFGDGTALENVTRCKNAQLVAIQNLMLSLLVLACHAKNVPLGDGVMSLDSSRA